MILSVPYYSQYMDVAREEWRRRSCSVVCLKMVLDFFGTSAPSIDALIDEGVLFGGFSQVGWSQNAIVALAAAHGVALRRKEYRTMEEMRTGVLSAQGEELQGFHTAAAADIARSLKEGKPVMVSVVKNFTEMEKFHMVVCTGLEIEGETFKGFYYHDPDFASAEDGKNRFVPLETFKKTWRRMAIFAA